MIDTNSKRLEASFRDPDGFLYKREGVLLRQVNESYAPDYDACVESCLFEHLISEDLLIPHTESDDEGIAPGKYRVLKPEEIPYVSYPYEWSFSQLKDAALLTLRIQNRALAHNLTLKDATAFNVQFREGRPVFIDTLSFQRYVDGEPWIAYRQFCQHFLAPLTLIANVDLRMRQLAYRYIDGLPLDLVSRILPNSTYLNYSTLAHIHLHSRSQTKHQDVGRENGARAATSRLSKKMLLALIASLTRAIEKLLVKDVFTEWGKYYSDTNYSNDAMQHKNEILGRMIDSYFAKGQVVHDLGANTGHFSNIIAQRVECVVAHDIDEMAVESHYRDLKSRGSKNILPLILDLANATPSIGWNLNERDSFHARANGSSAVALALIHHLCISNNVGLDKLARFFAGLFESIVIEFVPKEDSQVQRLLATRRDIFPDYHAEGFERSFDQYFEIQDKCPVSDSARIMYAMTNRNR